MALLLFCIKICVILLLAFYICKDLLPYSPAKWRSILMCSALLMCVLFPALIWLVPQWDWPLLSSNSYLEAGQLRQERVIESTFNWPALAKFYVGFALVFLAIQLKNYVILAYFHNTSTKWQGGELPAKGSIEVRTHPSIDVPCTYLMNQVLLPEKALDWPHAKLHHVLKHEEAHIEHRDWIVQNLFRLLVNVLWFLPPAWMALSYIKQQSELAADDRVIARFNIDPVDYAEELLAFHHSANAPASAVSFKRQKNIQLRVKALLDPQQDRSEVSQVKVLMTLLVALLFSSLLASINVKASVLPRPELTPWLSAGDGQTDEEVSLSVTVDEGFISHPVLENHLMPESLPLTMDKPEIDISVLEESFVDLDVSLSNAVDVAYVRIEGYIPKRVSTPQYPKRAEERRIEGYVVVEYDINEQGKVINPRIVKAKPKKIFNKNSLKALKYFEFEPQRINGQPVLTTSVRSKFVFSLKPFDAKSHKSPIPPKITGPTAIADLDSS